MNESTDERAPAGPRGELLEILAARLRAHRDKGTGCMVLVSGEPDIGKRHLIELFLDQNPNVRLLHVRCTGSDVPYAPFLELARLLHPPKSLPAGDPQDGSESSDGLDASGSGFVPLDPRGVFAADLLRSHVLALRRLGRRSLPLNLLRLNARALQDRYVDLLSEVATPLAQPPRVLLIENLQEADEDTLLVLQRLVSPPFPLASFVFGTFRDGKVRTELAELVHKVERRSASDDRFVHLRLKPLERTEARDYLEARFPDLEMEPGAAERLAEHCGWRPARLDAAVETLKRDGTLQARSRKGPPVLAADVDLPDTEPPGFRHLRLVSRELRQTLRRAAVLGCRFATGLLAGVEGRSEIGVLETLQEAHDRRWEIVEPSGDAWVFTDIDIPVALRAELLPPLRVAYAARAAGLLGAAQRRSSTTGLFRIPPARIAAMHERAGNVPSALAGYLAAAEHEETLLAIGGTIRHLELARAMIRDDSIEETTRTEHQWRLDADLARLLFVRRSLRGEPPRPEGDSDRAKGLALLSEALAKADALDVPVEDRAALRATLGVELAREEHTRTEGLNQVRRAKTLLVVAGMPDDALRPAVDEADILLLMGETEEAERVYRETLGQVDAKASELAFADVLAARCLLAIARVGLSKLPTPDVPAHTDARAAVLRDLEAARQRFRSAGLRDGEAASLTEMGRLFLAFDADAADAERRTKALDRAVETFEEACALQRAVADVRGLAATSYHLGVVRARMGRPKEASAALLTAGLTRLSLGQEELRDILKLLNGMEGVVAEQARTRLRAARGAASVSEEPPK